MSKVNLDYTGLKSGCVLNLNDTINIVNKALGYLDCFDIPSDFNKKSELKEVGNKLCAIKKDLTNIENWIVNSNNNYDTLVNNLNTQTNTLPTYHVKQRNNIV